MTTSRFATLVLAASLAVPALVQAQAPAASLSQVYTLGFDGVVNTTVTLNGVNVGPYRAHQVAPVAGSPFNIFCIDYDNSAKAQWNARVITFNDVINNSAANAAATAALGSPVTAAKLRTAAYLSLQFAAQPTSNWATIHGKLWSLFSTNANVSPFAALAQADVANASIGGNSAYDGYDMIIDNNAFTNACSAASCGQTFIIPDDGALTIRVVPEPSTYALMGAGLLVVGFISRRRRNVA
jgi:hypothetical protein